MSITDFSSYRRVKTTTGVCIVQLKTKRWPYQVCIAYGPDHCEPVEGCNDLDEALDQACIYAAIYDLPIPAEGVEFGPVKKSDLRSTLSVKGVTLTCVSSGFFMEFRNGECIRRNPWPNHD